MFLGILYLFLTFIFCFILVCLVKLAYIGIKSMKKQPEEEKKPTPKTEPVYYRAQKKQTIPNRKNFSSKNKIFAFSKKLYDWLVDRNHRLIFITD